MADDLSDLLDPLVELLRIPSVSAGDPNPEGLRQAADWLAGYVADAGGASEVLDVGGNPLVVGTLEANRLDAPTVLVYGHYDVQSPAPLPAWVTPPFEPTVRDGRLYARGASDDKGNLWPLVFTACALARAGGLPVRVRFVVEGEEEVGSPAVVRWLDADDEPADAAIIFDAGNFVDDTRPALTVGSRGLVQATITVTAASRDLHSGLYGGSVHNANHALMAALSTVLPGPDGRLRPELRAGIAEVPELERRGWADLPPGGEVLVAAGGRPLTGRAGAEYYERNWADASLDVNWIDGGQARTIVPGRSSAFLTMRLAPGQDNVALQRTLRDFLTAAAPAGVDVEVETSGVDAAAFDVESRPLVAARRVLREVCGVEPLIVRIGGTLPVMAPLARRGIPTILGGFAVAGDAIHAPNESFRLEALRLGAETARGLYQALGR